MHIPEQHLALEVCEDPQITRVIDLLRRQLGPPGLPILVLALGLGIVIGRLEVIVHSKFSS